jgi:hypothetical protein
MTAKKKSSGCGSTPTGDHEPDLTPPTLLHIPPHPTMEIITLKDPSKSATKNSTQKSKFLASFETLHTLVSGATIMIVLKKLQIEALNNFLDPVLRKTHRPILLSRHNIQHQSTVLYGGFIIYIGRKYLQIFL